MENINLKHALEVEGSTKALASSLGVLDSAISHWKKRGVPKAWDEVLRTRYSKRKPKAAK